MDITLSQILNTPVFQKLQQIQNNLMEMNPESSISKILSTIADEANALLGAYFCVVQPYIHHQDRFLLNQFTVGGAEEAKSLAWTEPRENGTSRTVLRNSVLIVNNYETEIEHFPFLKGSIGTFKEKISIRSFIGIRLDVSDEPVGVLFINFQNPHQVTDGEQALVRLFANLAATAIKNERLFGAAQDKFEDVIGSSQNILQEALRPTLNLKNFFSFVIDQTLTLLDFNAGWLLFKRGGQVVIEAADQEHVSDIGRSFELQDSIGGLSILESQIVNISDITDPALDRRYRDAYKSPKEGIKPLSELAVPLRIGEEIIGVFNIESHIKGAFTDRHERIMELINGHIASAITLARQRQEAHELANISAELAQKTELDDVLETILHSALVLIGARFGQIFSLIEDTLTVRITTNDPPTDRGTSLHIKVSVSGLAVIENRPIIVPNVEAATYFVVPPRTTAGGQSPLSKKTTGQPRYQRKLEPERARLQAEYAAPLFYNDSLLAVINLETAKQDGISQEQQNTLLEFINTNTQALADSIIQDEPDKLDTITRQIKALLDVEYVAILSIEGEHLILESTSGHEEVGQRFPVRDSVTGRVVLTEKPVYVPDVTLEPSYKRYFRDEMKSGMILPLVTGGRIVGVINLESPQLNFFTQEQAYLLESFADYAAAAFERAEKIEISQLAEIGSVAGDIVHRLNNPIGAISARIELLEDKEIYRELINTSPYMQRFFERTSRDLEKARTIIQELRDARLQAYDGQTSQTIVLQDAFEGAVQEAELPESIELILDLPTLPIVVIANRLLINVFWNLLDNARKAMPNGGKINVKTSILPKDKWTEVQMQDSGQGIESWRISTIFQVGQSTTEGDKFRPVEGMGLWWVQEQMKRYGGEITAQSEVGVGTCFTLRLRTES